MMTRDLVCRTLAFDLASGNHSDLILSAYHCTANKHAQKRCALDLIASHALFWAITVTYLDTATLLAVCILDRDQDSCSARSFATIVRRSSWPHRAIARLNIAPTWFLCRICMCLKMNSRSLLAVFALCSILNLTGVEGALPTSWFNLVIPRNCLPSSFSLASDMAKTFA